MGVKIEKTREANKSLKLGSTVRVTIKGNHPSTTPVY